MVKQKITMNIDKELLKKLKHIAIDKEKNVTEIVVSLIEKYVKEYYEE